MSDTAEEDRQLRMAQMRADIANKQADITYKTDDSAYKRGLLKYEPWKIVVTALLAGGALMGGFTALLTYLAPHYPPPAPPQQVIQLPPGAVITITPAQPSTPPVAQPPAR